MFEIIKGIISESYNLFNAMSPYLLLGFFFAGLLHVFIAVETIAKHLGKNTFSSVLKSVIFGIPLPLCSCGVIPAAMTLRKSGASKGAVISFLIATPITGIDSIFATYSLMGLFFAIYRVIASSITALAAGVLANITFKDEKNEHEHGDEDEKFCPHCQAENERKHLSIGKKVKELFRYGFVQLIGDVWKWLMIGIIIGGLISYLVPESFVENYLGNPWISMFVMLAVGIPMYICSTGSIPIAASLLMKGMNPGAALVFLLAGPATNTVTIAVVSKELGKKATVIYVGSIAVMSIIMGLLLDLVAGSFGITNMAEHIHSSQLPSWITYGSSIILLGLIMISALKKISIKN